MPFSPCLGSNTPGWVIPPTSAWDHGGSLALGVAHLMAYVLYWLADVTHHVKFQLPTVITVLMHFMGICSFPVSHPYIPIGISFTSHINCLLWNPCLSLWGNSNSDTFLCPQAQGKNLRQWDSLSPNLEITPNTNPCEFLLSWSSKSIYSCVISGTCSDHD